MSASSNMEAAIELAAEEALNEEFRLLTKTPLPQQGEKDSQVVSIRTFEQIQREWLDAVGAKPAMTLSDRECTELFVLGNRLLLEAHLSGQREAYGKVAGGRK